MKSKLGGLKIGGFSNIKKPLKSINTLKPAESVSASNNTISASLKVDVHLKQRNRTIQVSKTWSIDDFKNEIYKVFGLNKETVEIDGIVVVPKSKKKDNKMMDECDEGGHNGDS